MWAQNATQRVSVAVVIALFVAAPTRASAQSGAPVVPASAETPLQAHANLDVGVLVPLFGPFDPGQEVAITSLTASGAHGKRSIVRVVILPVTIPRDGSPSCNDAGGYQRVITTFRVLPDDTVHAAYTQPLLAPGGFTNAPWCLGALAATGNSFFTVVGYLKLPAQ